MLKCRITGNNDGQPFVRTYFEHTVINKQEFRGAATAQHLAEAFPSPDTQVRIQMGHFGVKFDPENAIKFALLAKDLGSIKHFTGPVTLTTEQIAMLKIGELEFKVEVKDVSAETGSDLDEGFTLFENCDIVVTRRANGVQVTRKQEPNCSIHISASNQFSARLNVTPSDGTDVRLTNSKDRPMVQFLPNKQL